MRMISTKIHACIDYISAIAMICSSILFQLSSQENYILLLTGIFTLLYSLFTNYEFAILHHISIHNHLKLDLLSGLILVSTPWIFLFSEDATIVFLLCGGIKFLLTFFSHVSPSPSRKYTGSFHKLYDMPMYRKMEKFPRMK